MNKTEWKSVHKELPKDTETVLVTVDSLIPYVTIAQYASFCGKWFWPAKWIKDVGFHGEITDGRVSAWMPLPKAYKNK